MTQDELLKTDTENRRIAIESALRLCPLNYTNTTFKIEELIKNATTILSFLNNQQS